MESLIYFVKLQFMSKYIQGLLPSSFNNAWIKIENWRAENFSMVFIYQPLFSLKLNAILIFCSLNYGVSFQIMISKLLETMYNLMLH